GGVPHDVVGELEGDPPVPAKLGVGGGEVVQPVAGRRVDNVRAVQVQAEFAGASPDGVGVAEQGQVADVAAQQGVGGAQDPVLGALGQDEVPAVLAGALDQLVLEHHRCG